jgi:hypothetical protein
VIVGTNKLPSDEQMDLWREEGRLVCTCRDPIPWLLPMWRCSECRLCGKLIIKRDAARELLRRRAELAKRIVL